MNSNSKSRLAGQIESVTVIGFRGLARVEDLKLPQLSVLIGGNGSGKSTLIRYFEMLGWMLRSRDLQGFTLQQGGGDDQFHMGARVTPVIETHVRMKTTKGVNEYRFSITHVAAGDRLLVLNEAYRFSPTGLKQDASWTNIGAPGFESALATSGASTPKTICNLLRNIGTFQFHDTSKHSAIHKRWSTGDGARLRSDGGNLAAVLFAMRDTDPARFHLVQEQIRRVVPNFGEFVLDVEFETVLLRWRGRVGDKVFGSHLTSDGSLRLFCLITLLNTRLDRLPDVIFFDEPELGLHPHALELIAAMIKRVAQVKQLFVATQSPALVDCFDLDNLIVATSEEGEVSLSPMSHSKYQDWLDDDYLPSDLWLKNPIGGTA